MNDLTPVLSEYGPLVFIIYVLIKDILPKMFPQVLAVFSSKITIENRLFDILERNNQANLALAKALNDLTHALEILENRVGNLEDAIIDKSRIKLIIPAS